MTASPLRRATLAACLLALALPSAAAARDRALGAAESLFSTRALLQEAHLHGPDHARGRELTPVLAKLAARLRTLPGSDRREAARLLARPTDRGADPQQNGYSTPEAHGSPFCSARFCVHWVASGADAPDLTDTNGNGVPDYVEEVDGVAEHVFAVENGTLGWRVARGDGRLGGGVNLTDIYLKDLGGSGVYGYTAPDPGQLGPRGGASSLYAYLVVDNSFSAAKFPRYVSPLPPLEVTLAHEYNHVLQFNYDALEDTWMFESSAVWMEGKVYPEVHDYLQYLPGWVSLTRVPLTRFDGTDPNDRSNVKVYGSAVWNKWLEARYGQDVVRAAWERSSATRPASFAPAAYSAAIRAHGGAGFSDAFARFSAATAEWRSGGSGFPDGPSYPDVQRVGGLSPDGAGATLRLSHTTFALLDVRRTAAARIKLVVAAPRNVSSAVALVERRAGAEAVQLVELPHGGRASLTLASPASYERVTAVVVNADSSERGYSPGRADWQFTKDNEPYAARVTTDFRAPRARPRAPRPGAHGVSPRAAITLSFSKRVLGVSPRSLRLIGPNGRAVRVRVRLTAHGRSATVTPVAALRPHSRYRIKVLGGITDADLNRVVPVSWSFSTRG